MKTTEFILSVLTAQPDIFQSWAACCFVAMRENTLCFFANKEFKCSIAIRFFDDKNTFNVMFSTYNPETRQTYIRHEIKDLDIDQLVPQVNNYLSKPPAPEILQIGNQKFQLN